MEKDSINEVRSGKNPEPFEFKRSVSENIESTIKAYSAASGYNFTPVKESFVSEKDDDDLFFEDDRKDTGKDSTTIFSTEIKELHIGSSDRSLILIG